MREAVEVEGWRGSILRTSLESMPNMDMAGSVNLLSLFDAYVMGIGRGEEIEALPSV
jgi:hypothetical protein